jgi:DNA-binding transcriptional LysR family regulator
MIDSVTLAELRVFLVVVEEGSFSAAARKLRRVQSAVSQAMSNLEGQLGVRLWDRSTRLPTLTAEGRSVLAAAERVVGEVDALRKLAAGMASGLEAHVSLCVDALFPLAALVDACADFAKDFPSVDLRVDTQTMSAVSARVLSGAATLGVVSPMGLVRGLERRTLAPIRMIPVVSANHPLARVRGRIPTARLVDHVQIVLSERHDEGVPDQAVLSPRTWRVADLHTKHALLRAGLGWGNLPEHLVRAELRQKRLVRIQPDAWGVDEHKLYLSVIHRADVTFGPAHRWLLARLEKLCVRETRRAGGKNHRRN